MSGITESVSAKSASRGLARAPLWSLYLAALLLCFSARAQDEGPGDLIEKLRADSFDQRRAATEKLEALGETARAALEKAATDDDPELRQTVSGLLKKLKMAGPVILAFDRDGKPAVGAEAIIILADWHNRYQRLDHENETFIMPGDGKCKLRELPTGLYYLTINWKKWFGLLDPWAIAGYPLNLRSGPSPLLCFLTRGGALKGSLQDAEGKPLKDAQLLLYPGAVDEELIGVQIKSHPLQVNYSGSSDAKGSVGIENIPDGVYQCVAKQSESDLQPGPVIRIREGETVEVPPLRLKQRAPAKLILAFQDADGVPLKKVKGTGIAERLFDGPQALRKQRLAQALKYQYERFKQPDALTTDQDGKVTIDALEPGRYRITAQTAKFAPLEFEVLLAPGETAAPEPRRFSAGGSISGVVKTIEGKPVKEALIYSIPLRNGVEPAGVPRDLLNYIQRGDSLDQTRSTFEWLRGQAGAAIATSDAGGAYTSKCLAPGAYCLFVAVPGNQTALIGGLMVEEGKAIQSPEVKFKPVGSAAPSRVSGKVLGQNGKGLSNASISLVHKGGSWGSGSSDDGSFQINTGLNLPPVAHLVVKAQGYKTRTVNLDAPGVNPDSLTVQLEKQEYGALRLKVVDEAGHPLEDASVLAALLRRDAYYAVGPRMQNTNQAGEARFTGLAVGFRHLEIRCSGYYVNDPVRVGIEAGVETRMTVALQKGLVISGSVEAPPGVALANVIVSVHNGKERTTLLSNPQGEFSISGLAPGDYTVNARSPLLMTPEPQKVVLKAGGPVERVKLRLVRGGFAAVQVNPAFRGYNAQLMREEAWARSDSSGYSNSGDVDGSGRIEFWGVAPGTYRLVLYSRNNLQDLVDAEEFKETVRARATQVLGPLELKPLDSFAALKDSPPVKLEPPPGRGSARFNPVCDGAPPAAANNGYWEWRLAGVPASAQFYFNPAMNSSSEAGRPQVIGPLPESLKPAAGTSVRIHDLPAGEYKLLFNWRSYSGAGFDKKNSQLVSTFTLKDGEQLDLGALHYTPPALPAEALSVAQPETEPSPEDDAEPDFQP